MPAREEMDAAKESLEEACARYAVLASTEVLVASDIGNAIVDKAREMDASLIAVGTHGRKGVERMLLGSVAERVLRNAPCPVVAVRRP